MFNPFALLYEDLIFFVQAHLLVTGIRLEYNGIR